MTVNGTNINSRSGERGEELMSFVGRGPSGRLQNMVQPQTQVAASSGQLTVRRQNG